MNEKVQRSKSRPMSGSDRIWLLCNEKKIEAKKKPTRWWAFLILLERTKRPNGVAKYYFFFGAVSFLPAACFVTLSNSTSKIRTELAGMPGRSMVP